MGCSSRLSRTRKTGTGRRLATAVAMVLVLVVTVAAASSSVQAQTIAPAPAPSPSPTPSPTPTSINSDLSAGAAVTNLGSNFLERLGSQASSGFGRALRTNPGGGGASEATDAPQFRTWGGVAGLGARIGPGVNVGMSIDQSRTAIDVPLALQSAALDLTQLGF